MDDTAIRLQRAALRLAATGTIQVLASSRSAGMLMFGWSTALLVRVVQRTDRSGQEV